MSVPSSSPQDRRFLAPRTIQRVGIGLLVVFTVFWMVTGRQSILLVGSAGSLILLGGYERLKMQAFGLLEQSPAGGGPPEEPPPEGSSAP